MNSNTSQNTSISINVIGTINISSSTGLPLSLPTKAKALLIYLAMDQKKIFTKEHIKGLLWSESSQKHASGSLRQCLKKINDKFREIGNTGFKSEGSTIELDDDHFTVDLLELHNHLDMGLSPHDSSSFYTEFLFQDLDTCDQSFDSWLQVQRQLWSDKLQVVLEKNIKSKTLDSETKYVHARMLHSLDKTHEEACRFLMRYYASRNNLGPIYNIYETLSAELEHHFGAEPSVETSDLYLSIQTGNYKQSLGHTNARISDSHTSIDEPVIGVNIFAWSGDQTQNTTMHTHFFRNELMAALSKFREWIVVDTKNRNTDDPYASDVNYYLDGTCYQVHEFTDILITVTDAVTGQLWSETTRIETKSWINAQRAIVSKIAIALNIYLSKARISNAIASQGLAQTAHESWLTGYQHMLSWNPASDRKAESTFTRIVEEYPGFAPAYSSLATVLNTRHFKHIGVQRSANLTSRALKYAQKAATLDPLESRTQLALGFSYAMNNQFEQAQLHLSLARELNPNSPISVVPCAHGLSYCGLHTDAVELVDWAEKVNSHWMPSFHWAYISCVRFLARDFNKAVSAARMANGVIIDLHAWHAAALALKGQTEDARYEAQQFLELSKKHWEGENEPTMQNIVQWFLSSFPIRLEDDANLLEEGLARAGLTRTAQISN